MRQPQIIRSIGFLRVPVFLTGKLPVRRILSPLRFVCLLATTCPFLSLKAQLLYVGPADFGGRTGTAIFQFANGVVSQLNTGLVEHNFPSVSRDNRFITFSSPDGVIPALQVPPSSDIFVHDRARGVTTRSVNHTTDFSNLNSIAVFTPVSAELSPNNRLLAYGVSIALRQGGTSLSTTRELNIADPATGVILSNPTFGRGPVSDSLQAEFVGLSWDPGGNSFVTVNYVSIQSDLGTPVDLPAIVRFSFNANNNTWSRTGVLSQPRYLNNQFPPAGITQIYPCISPSGAGLAYFNLNWPDILGSSVGVIAQLIIANADGSNARILSSFAQGFYPAGLAWAPDGASLIVSIAQQQNIGTGFLPSANATTAVTRAVSTADGSITPIPGLPQPAFFPTWRGSNLAGSLAGVSLIPSINSSGQLRLNATNVQPDRLYFLQSSPSLQPGSFGAPQSFSGAQLQSGIDVNSPTATRFFRLIEQ